MLAQIFAQPRSEARAECVANPLAPRKALTRPFIAYLVASALPLRGEHRAVGEATRVTAKKSGYSLEARSSLTLVARAARHPSASGVERCLSYPNRLA